MDNEEKKNEQVISNKNKSYLWFWILAVLVLVASGVFWFLGSHKNDKTAGSLTSGIDEKNEIAGTKKGKPADPNQYNWSTMSQGPYHDRVSYATGTSLTKWTDAGKILAEHASVPDAIVNDKIIHLYFVDVTEDGKPEQIGHLSSSDNGVTWGAKTIVTIEGLGNKAAVDPAPFLLDDGRIRLYYFDISTTKTGGTKNNTIYSAISTDGINFVEEAGTRFTYADIYDPDVIKVDGIWRMYVGTASQKVLSATSTDGLSFTYEGVAFSGGSIPNVVYENGTYYLFTGGIEISTSKDGKTFTKTADRFDSGKLTADPGVAKLGENSYFMTYKTDDGSKKALTPQ